MLILVFDPHQGKVVPDARAEEEAYNTIQSYLKQQESLVNVVRTDVERVIGSDILLCAYRLWIAKGIIDHNQVQVKHHDKLIRIDKFGSLQKWPDDFNQYHDKLLMELTGWVK